MDGANQAEFDQTSTCPVPPATLAAGGTCSISVTFKPTSTGAKSAALLISNDGGGSPASASLTGTGASALQTQAADSTVVVVPTMLPGAIQTLGDPAPPSGAKRKTKAKAVKKRTELR